MTLWLGAQSLVLALWVCLSALIGLDLMRRVRRDPPAFASFRIDPATRPRRMAWLVLSALLALFLIVSGGWLAINR